jgi:hypothetical protein
MAYSRRHEAWPGRDDQPANPVSPRYGFIAFLEWLQGDWGDRNARVRGTAINVA